ncbi:hypothetical protein BDV93DRAFT_437849, partial [Ceratobasidium sp. AG-I]
LAHCLRYMPADREEFKRVCVEEGLLGPHNVRRDVQMRWNSTNNMLEDIESLWPAVIEFQKTSRWVPHNLVFAREERKAVRALLATLNPLQIVTKILSQAGVPMLANIIVHYDVFDAEYAEMCNDQTLPPYQRHAANQGRILFNKYYQKTDESEMYRLAIRRSIFYSLL